MTQLTVQDRIAQAEAAHREGRIIQGAWRRTNGKEMVCALAAWADEHPRADQPTAGARARRPGPRPRCADAEEDVARRVAKRASKKADKRRPDARRDLRPLFDRPAVRDLGRGPGAAVPGTRGARRLDVVAEFLDPAMSGATRDRPQLVAMMARAAEFDVVLAESLDRLSRDQEDIAAIHKRLRFAGVEIVTLPDGAIGEIHIGLKGTMAALFLRDLGEKTRRGQIGRVAPAASPAASATAMSKVHRSTPTRRAERGLRAINEDEAAIVRRIFREYLLAGISPREIARGSTPKACRSPAACGAPRPSPATAAAQRHPLQRALRRPHRLQPAALHRDPDTRGASPGRTRREWVTAGRARAAHRRRSHLGGRAGAARARRDPAGAQAAAAEAAVLRAAGAANAAGRSRSSGEQWGCANHRETGTCGNNRLTLNSEIERRVLGALRGRPARSRLVSEYAPPIMRRPDALARHAATQQRSRSGSGGRRAVKRLVAAIAAGADVAEIKAR
jgi:site-specific DNA recombinase